MTVKKTNKKGQKTAAEIGSLGGRALCKKYGREYMRKIAKKAAKARWQNKLSN
jgi:hypothetical protein